MWTHVFVSNDGRTKTLDFGLAKFAPQPDAATIVAGHTAIGSIAGTISYMSPEQILGKELDIRSDLFSYGVVLCEMGPGAFVGPTIPKWARPGAKLGQRGAPWFVLR